MVGTLLLPVGQNDFWDLALPSESKHGLHDDWLLYFSEAIIEKKVAKGPIRMIKGLERFICKRYT